MSKIPANIYDRVQNTCHRLNAEAYETQVIANNRKPIKKFTPCARAVELMKVITENKHMGETLMYAGKINCGCHTGLSEGELMKYGFDPTYKIANYEHNHRVLYPRLYRGQG